ncbi:MAG: ASCH domain-containing protein [Clostridia bacterium]|nr:ASCH domain-containing protein [Clostridia bacterium]
MIHKMKLNSEPFSAMLQGRKTVEMRLNDEKRQLIKERDFIEFYNRDTGEGLIARVVKVTVFKDFHQLYASYDKTALGYLPDEDARAEDMSQYYDDEEIEKYGVMAIEIHRL